MTKQSARREKRDLHFLNANGMVACNPRDREAAHRAQIEGTATDDPVAVTCRKCRDVIKRTDAFRKGNDDASKGL